MNVGSTLIGRLCRVHISHRWNKPYYNIPEAAFKTKNRNSLIVILNQINKSILSESTVDNLKTMVGS